MKFNGIKVSEELVNQTIEDVCSTYNLRDIVKNNTNEELLNYLYLQQQFANEGIEFEIDELNSIIKKQSENTGISTMWAYSYGKKVADNTSQFTEQFTDSEYEGIMTALKAVKQNSENGGIDGSLENLGESITSTTNNLLSEREKELAELAKLKKAEEAKKKKEEAKARKRIKALAKKENRIKKIRKKKGFPSILSFFIKPIDKDKDYYSDLGVDINSKSRDIEEAYLYDYDMRMSLHNLERKDEENIESFKKTRDAYKILKHKGSRDWYLLHGRVNNEEIDDATLKAALKGRMFIRKLPKRVAIFIILSGLAYGSIANRDKIGNLFNKAANKVVETFDNIFDDEERVLTYDDNEVQAIAGNSNSQIDASTLTDNQTYNVNDGTNGTVYNGGVSDSYNSGAQTLNAPNPATNGANGYKDDILTDEYWFDDADNEEQVYLRAAAINKYLYASNVHSFTDDEIAEAIKFINGSYTPQSEDYLYDLYMRAFNILAIYGSALTDAPNFGGDLVSENGVKRALGLNAFLVDNSEHSKFLDEASTLLINMLTSNDAKEMEDYCTEFFNQMAYLSENMILDENGDKFGYENLTPSEGFVYGLMVHMADPLIKTLMPNCTTSFLDNNGKVVNATLDSLEVYYGVVSQCNENTLDGIENDLLKSQLENTENRNPFINHFNNLINKAINRLRNASNRYGRLIK